jgi:hypothetical protein
MPQQRGNLNFSGYILVPFSNIILLPNNNFLNITCFLIEDVIKEWNRNQNSSSSSNSSITENNQNYNHYECSHKYPNFQIQTSSCVMFQTSDFPLMFISNDQQNSLLPWNINKAA